MIYYSYFEHSSLKTLPIAEMFAFNLSYLHQIAGKNYLLKDIS